MQLLRPAPRLRGVFHAHIPTVVCLPFVTPENRGRFWNFTAGAGMRYFLENEAELGERVASWIYGRRRS